MNTTLEPKITRADVLIIGNGALGLFLANELKMRGGGKEVVVVGPRDREAGASQAAGAMLGCFGEVTADTLRTDAGRARFEIGVEAHKYWDTALQRLQETSPGGKRLKVSDDTYIVLNSIGHVLDSNNFEAIIGALKAYDQPWSEVDAKTIVGFNPRPDCRAFRCIRLANEGAIDARGVLAALEARLKLENVAVVDQTVRKILGAGGTATGVELQDGSIIEAAVVVVAAGARSEALVRTAAEDLTLMPTFPGLGLGMIARRSRGQAFQSVVRTPNRGFGCGLHVVPCGDGREYLGSTNRIVHQVMNVAWLEDLRYLTKYSMQQLDEEMAHHQVEQWLRGNRPITYDGFPLVGWLPMNGLYLMTGTFRDGFHAAPLLAAHVANEIDGKAGLLDSMFKPTRTPVVTRTIEYSIEEYAQNSIATWYEVGSDSCEMPTKVLEKFYCDKARKIYDTLGINYGIGPDVLWYAVGDDIGAQHIKRYVSKM
jgi:glycine oxidase